MRQKLIIVGVISAIVLLFGISIWSAQKNAKRSATIDVEVVPTESQIQINNKRAKVGKQKIEPGNLTITVSKTGFITETRQVTAKAKVESFIGISLVPNTAATNDWYVVHPEDAQKAEGISSQNFDVASSALANNPLVKRLPFIGAGFEFRIDYGAPRDPNNPGQPIIYIQAATVSGRQDGLQWIKSFGYDPATMDIVFKDVVNPFSGIKS